jgi:hypothetical protein
MPAVASTRAVVVPLLPVWAGISDNGKPVERRGRKATRLPRTTRSAMPVEPPKRLLYVCFIPSPADWPALRS